MSRNFRGNERGVNPFLAMLATGIFAVYTGLLIYSAPMNHTLGIGLYVVGVLGSSIPAFYAHPHLVAIGLSLTTISFALFLSSVYVWHL